MKIKSPIKFNRKAEQQRDQEAAAARLEILENQRAIIKATEQEKNELIGFQLINTLALVAIAAGVVYIIFKLKKSGLL